MSIVEIIFGGKYVTNNRIIFRGEEGYYIFLDIFSKKISPFRKGLDHRSYFGLRFRNMKFDAFRVHFLVLVITFDRLSERQDVVDVEDLVLEDFLHPVL
ncbi:MAG: hypothetical protein CMI51_13005 [Paracoccus sp.]|nr:hypothetical protein [Paracoccus sp. (in: a-proteobacteria)]